MIETCHIQLFRRRLYKTVSIKLSLLLENEIAVIMIMSGIIIASLFLSKIILNNDKWNYSFTLENYIGKIKTIGNVIFLGSYYELCF